MAAEGPVQTYENHAKLVPAFHYLVLPVLFGNVGWTLWRVLRAPGLDGVVDVLVAAALAFLAIYARVFALRVQDRVIRLEMRLRMKDLLPAALQPHIKDFTIDQLVALRFASDAELPELAAAVLRDDLQDRRTIKKLIKSWTPDLARA